MQNPRRTVCRAALALATLTLLPLLAAAHPIWRPNAPRWRRARPPHLTRRRIQVRWVHGRSIWVVPVGLAAGWELWHDDRPLLVRGTRFVVLDGELREVVTVADAGGRLREIEILREDVPDTAASPSVDGRS